MRRFIFGLAKALAMAGGIVLVMLIAITCLSVLGRIANTVGHADMVENSLGFVSVFLKKLGPINGDYELVEAGVAFAIFAFLPWCQLQRGHATVEVLGSLFPDVANRFLNFLWQLVFALAIALIAWRLFAGMSDKLRYGETTFLLQMPVWWAFAICVFAACVAVLAALYSVWVHGLELFEPKRSGPENRSAGH